MKKQILMVSAVCAAACCLAGCGEEPVVSEYDALNQMLNAHYSQIAITVTDAFDENTWLTSDYVIDYSDSGITVTYSVERFAEIDDSFDDLLTDVKKTLTGKILIQDGEVTLVEGDDVGLTAEIAKVGLNFQEEYFENAQLAGMSLSADVKNTSGFMGISVSNMKVEATFLEVFSDIHVTYTSSSGSEVEYTFVFTL